MNTRSPVARALLGAAAALLAPRRIPPLPAAPREILVVRQHDQLGDMICVGPTLRALRTAYPAARITLVAGPMNHDVMLGHPAVDRVVRFDNRTALRSPRFLPQFLRSLRSPRPDLAIVPSTVSISLTSCLIARLSGAAARIGPGRLEGLENPARFLFTHPVDLDWTASPARHQTLRNADILAPLGIAAAGTACELSLTPEEERRARRELEPLRSGHRRLVGFHPGAAKPGNRWPAANFAALAAALHESPGCAAVVTAGPRDAGPLAEFLSHLSAPALVIHGRPIREVAAIVNGLDLYVSNDTGPLHIAGALRPAALGLFGPTDARVWAPAGGKNHFVASPDGDIASITVDEVLQICRILLGRPEAEERRFN